MDCSMPIMDGYQASLKVRSLYQHMLFEQPYIVACTGHTEEEFVKKAWKSKINEVIPKPAKIEQIVQILSEQVVLNL